MSRENDPSEYVREADEFVFIKAAIRDFDAIVAAFDNGQLISARQRVYDLRDMHLRRIEQLEERRVRTRAAEEND